MQVFDRRLNILMCIVDVGDFRFNAACRLHSKDMHPSVYMLLT
jgi:hypothetical protein